MSIERIVDLEVVQHLAMHGCVKHMDPMALHVLKTSQHPLIRARRNWMYLEAARQAKAAERRQKKINDAFREQEVKRGAGVRRAAVIDPYYAAKETMKHSSTWNNKDFISSMRRDNPAIFPKRIVV